MPRLLGDYALIKFSLLRRPQIAVLAFVLLVVLAFALGWLLGYGGG